ncbi:ankyrin repeat domain-containing protein 39-like [Anneissia japonica]|uniref:ankyrin repeat domain-containing protein 39-like n=1 Tax=Anneissia japonica TaxID=1529436 RepID=UPI0014259E4E|nr:ankyrin repeat domain-containing protein 39-like [Anneissia japonica]
MGSSKPGEKKDEEERGKLDGATALYTSAFSGHTDICRLLIQSGANKDIQRKDGATALHASAFNGHNDICRLLIQSGANKDIQENDP